jgi:hypothetical protein
MISQRNSLKAALVLITIGATPFFAIADGDEHEGEHFDIAVWNDNGTLRTGGWDHDTEELEVQNLRVFEGTMGEDSALPYSTDEPGVGGVAADLGLMVGETFSLNIASGLGVWTGSGFNYGADSMIASWGGLTVNTNTGGALDFLITEDYDNHPFYTMETETPGAYLMEVTASMAGYQSSDVFYILFNSGLDDEAFEEAHEYVENVLVPAPGALALLGLLGATRRRRRQN